MRGLFDTPELGPCTVTLWPYQEEAIEAIRGEFKKGVRRTLLSMATGLGKTIVAAMVARKTIEKGGRVLFLAHTSELIEQTADKFDMLGVEPGVEQAGQFARSMFDAQAVVGSVATMMKPGRLASWPDDYFNLVIIDEGHRSVAPSYKTIMAHFKKAAVIVMTATPVRGDGQALDYVCESLAYRHTIIDAWERGKAEGRQYLCDLLIKKPKLGVKLKHLRRREEDFSDSDYDARIRPILDVIINYAREEIGDSQTIEFWPTIRAAQLAADAQKQWYTSEAVWGADPDRQQKVKAYRAGEIQALSNMDLFREGWDVPSTSAILLARNTNSWAMMLQQIGRGIRAGKPLCKVLDIGALTDKFGEDEGYLVQPADIIGEPGFDQEIDAIREELKAIQEREPELTLMNAVEQAKEEVKKRKQQFAVRMSIAERQVECDQESYSAMEAYASGEVVGPTARAPKVAEFVPATDGQKRFLRVLGFGDEVDRLSKGRAGLLISYGKRQREAGKSTVWQRGKLARKGVDMADARQMDRADAAQAVLDLYTPAAQRVRERRAAK